MTASISTESLVYTERTDIGEPSQEDIEEYAKRIGIDIQTEPDLLYLARDGLKQPLPKGWKPVFDLQKQAWYYFNGKLNLTQWEHPLDNVYREKVNTVREELDKERLAMNNLLSFDPLTMRPPKSLPPLKRAGANLAPINPAFSSLGKLGGLRPAAEDLRQPNSNSNSLSHKANNSANIISNSLGHFNNNSHLSGGSLNSFKDTDEDDDDSVRVMRPRKTGLKLTGGGANFIKGPEGKSKGSLLKSSSIEGSEGTHESDAGAAGDSERKPIKSILVNSLSRSRPANFAENVSELEGFSMNMEEMTDEEKLVLSQLESSGGSKSKGNVKFNLDDNTELKFELSGNENEDHSPNNGKRNTDDDTEEASVINGRNTPEEENLAGSPIPISLQGDKWGNKSNDWRKGSSNRAETPPFIAEYSEEDIETMKKAMREGMEAELRMFKEQLERERKTRQEQIQQHLNETVTQFRLEKEDTIRMMRKELENETATEIDKAKQELDCVLQAEVKEMSTNFELKLQERQKELEREHKERISALAEEYRKREEEKISQVILQKENDDIVKAAETELKRQKENLREDHKLQISQLKEYHKSVLHKLQAELLMEEDKLRQDHELKQAEIVSQFDQRTAELKEKLLRKQREDLERIQREYEAEKAAFKKQKTASLENIKDQIEQSQRSFSEVHLADTSAENELRLMKGKYQQLESKYKSMEQELNQLSKEMSIKRRNSIGGISSPKLSPSQPPDPPSSKKNDSSNIKMNTTLDGSETNQDSANGSESNSDTNSSIYPSSDHIHRHRRTKKADLESSKQSNRINAALEALDILKQEILDLKESNSTKSGASKDHSRDIATTGKIAFKSGLHSNPKPQTSRQILKHDSKSYHEASSRKKASSHTLPSYSSKSARVKVSSPSPPTHDNPTEPQHQPKFVSRSVSVVPQDFSGPSSDPVSEDTHQKIVEDAKAFIRMQKNRLKDPSPITSSAHLIVPSTKNNLLLFDEKLLKSVSPRRPASLHLDLVSETESSGVSSLKDHRSSESKQLSKDIAEICNSLISLDQQMKLMWSVVKDKQKCQNDSRMSPTSDLSAFLPNTIPMMIGGGKSISKSSASVPSTARKTLKPSPSMIPGNLLPSGSVPAKHYASLLSSPNPASNSQTVLEALRMSGLSRSRLDCTDLLKSLEDELKEFRTTKHRLKDIQEKFPGDEKPDSPRHNTTSSNILAKTKDLQEWIKKY